MSSVSPCVDIPASSGFAGESRKPREYCDPFEVAEVLPLCSVATQGAASNSERQGVCFKALAAKFVPRADTGMLCFWCCNANSDREMGPHEEDEVTGSVLCCDVGFLNWCWDDSSERESVVETKLFPKGRLL